MTRLRETKLTNSEALALFQKAGALLSGHFLLSSGKHSDAYLEKFRLVERPALLEPMCEELASGFRNDRVEMVHNDRRIILAYNVSRFLGVEARFAEKGGWDPSTEARADFAAWHARAYCG